MDRLKLYKALFDFQQEVPNIYKNSTGYGYKFADLGEINDIIKPILFNNGLGYIQPIEGQSIRTIIFHVESGESIESLTDIPQGVQLAKMNEFQVLGSAITYLRRYSLSSMLGLVTDEDADAAGDQVKPKATLVIRDRVEESKAGAEPMAQTPLQKAKDAIFKQLEKQGYDTAMSKLAFVSSVLKKDIISTIDDANLVADALDNEASVAVGEEPVNKWKA